MRYAIRYIFLGVMAFLACSCTKPDDQKQMDGKLIKATLQVSTMEPEDRSLIPVAKAPSQMMPEKLNPIKTLAVFQYDPEGNYRRFDFRDYTNGGTSPGEMSVSLDVEIQSYTTGSATICLIANMPEEMCRDIYDNSPLLTDFQAYHKVIVPYEGMSGTNLGTGHLTTSYMSGFYEGPITENTKQISIALGRIISNFNIGITCSEDFVWNCDPQDVTVQLQNIPMQTFAFPPRVSDYEGLEIPRGSFQEESLSVSTGNYTRCYYYVAAFAALTEDDACRLRISTTINGQNREATVLLGNDEPGTPNRSYNVWRNSNYTFNLRLVPKGNKKSQYEARPGEIIVPL